MNAVGQAIPPVHQLEWIVPVILIVILGAPISRYLAAGWEVKRSDIMNSLGSEARKSYLVQFLKHDSGIETEVASREFEKSYLKRYGRRFFAFPVLLILLVTLAEAYLVSENTLAAMQVIAKPWATLSP